MKKLFLILLTLSASAFAAESFNYASIGIYGPFPLPSITVGHSHFEEKRAIDVSGSLATLLIGNEVSASVKYLRFFDKNYFGVGGKLSYFSIPALDFKGGAFAPVMSIGKDNERSFHQLNISIPHFCKDEIIYIPTFQYEYGFKF